MIKQDVKIDNAELLKRMKDGDKGARDQLIEKTSVLCGALLKGFLKEDTR